MPKFSRKDTLTLVKWLAAVDTGLEVLLLFLIARPSLQYAGRDHRLRTLEPQTASTLDMQSVAAEPRYPWRKSEWVSTFGATVILVDGLCDPTAPNSVQ